MRRLLAGGAISLALAGATPAFAQSTPAAPPPTFTTQVDTENLAIAREIVEIGFPPERRHDMMMGAGHSMMEQMRSAIFATTDLQSDAGARELFDRFVARATIVIDHQITTITPVLFDAFARAYARQFSHDDLVDIRAFVRTPAGQHYFQRSQTLLADPDVAQVNRAYLASLMTAMQPLQEQLSEEARDYIAHHRHNASPGT